MEMTIGIAGAVGFQMASCFALGWWLSRQSSDAEANRVAELRLDTLTALSAITKTVDVATGQHIGVLALSNNEMRALVATPKIVDPEMIVTIVDRVLSANDQLRGELVEVTKTLAGLGAKMATTVDVQPAMASGTQRVDSAAALNRGGQCESKLPEQEVRKESARPFHGKAFVAPCEADSDQAAAIFYQVEGREVSTVGFSYWADERPQYKFVLVRFEGASESIEIKAEVIAVSTLRNDRDRRYSVDCSFLKRVSQPSMLNSQKQAPLILPANYLPVSADMSTI